MTQFLKTETPAGMPVIINKDSITTAYPTGLRPGLTNVELKSGKEILICISLEELYEWLES